MEKINVPTLLTATLVTLMFVAAGAAITYKNIWIILLFLVLGFAIMGFGISQKKKRK